MKKVLTFLSLLICLTLSASADGQSPSLDEMLEKIRSVNDPDTARFLQMADQAMRLAKKEGNVQAQASCLKDRIIYETTHGMMDGALRSLQNLKQINEATGRFDVELYDSWKNIAQAYFNNNSIMASMAEMQQMRKYAMERKNDYGMACVFMSFGTFYARSYETSMKSLNQALACLEKAGALENHYVIYYSMAFTADCNARYEEMLQYVEQMVQVDPNSAYVQQVADFMRLGGYVELNDQKNATLCYKRLKALWDDYEIYGNLESNVVYSMVQYLCKFGNPDEVPDLLQFISEDYTDLRYAAETLYFLAKGDYRRAYESLKAQKEVEDGQLAEQQRAEMANANAYFQNQHLEEEKRQLMLVSAQRQNILLLVVVTALIILGASAGYIAVSTRRYNSKLKIERDHVEEERKRAVAMSEMKTAFINSMTHEIRTPLNHISGFASLLAMDGFSAAERQDFERKLQDGTNQLAEILDKIIVLADTASPSGAPEKEEVDVNRLCQKLLDDASELNTKGLELHFLALEEHTFSTNESYLSKAIYNLLTNALKFTEKGSIVLAVGTTDGGALQITVTDTGIGIPKEKREWVFNQFTKIDNFVPGVGVGLYLTRHFITQLGGRVYIDGQYTGGSRFVIELT